MNQPMLHALRRKDMACRKGAFIFKKNLPRLKIFFQRLKNFFHALEKIFQALEKIFPGKEVFLENNPFARAGISGPSEGIQKATTFLSIYNQPQPF